MKLQPGDYVSTEGMTEEEYHAVCRAFIEAGAKRYNDPWPYNEFDSMGWAADSVYIISCGYGSVRANHCFKRELTKDQILGAQKMTIGEAYKFMQDNCGIEAGDIVRVLRKPKSMEMGWDNSPPSERTMSAMVGQELKVIGVDEDIRLDTSRINGGRQRLPFFVLELVEKGKKLPESIEISSSYDATFNEDGSIYVGCQHIDFNTIEKIYHAAKGVIGND